MRLASLALRGLRFHWRGHLGTLAGATVATAILLGALLVGDSVRYSLRSQALERLGGTHLALIGRGRFFRTGLADNLAGSLRVPVSPLLRLSATASSSDGEVRAGSVQALGVDDRFWAMAGARPPSGLRGEGAVVVNRRLAARLGVKPGEEILLRVDKPSLLSRDAPLSTLERSTVALRLQVAAIASDDALGRFGLDANQVPPLNAFLPLSLLQREVSLRGRSNVLLLGERGGYGVTPQQAAQALWRYWGLADVGLRLRELPGRRLLELTSESIFIDPAVAKAALGIQGAQGVLTYLVNDLRVRDRSTPYSIVTAMQGGPVPPGMADGGVLLNEWLARDLGASPGDDLMLSYYTVGRLRHFTQRSSSFRVAGVVPLSGAAADRGLMPDFPGVTQRKSCRDWEPGIPIDLHRIRDRDEEYWKRYQGTPKAFLTLAAGQRLWGTQWGNLTAIRYPEGKSSAQALELCIKQALNPSSLGLLFVPVREQALRAAGQSMDFGQLFLGFSLFLIVAALLLTALLFGLGAEQRSEEVGTLLALGWTRARARGLLMLEGAAVALPAVVLGAGAGVLYTRAILAGLSTVWSGAVAGSELRFHAEPGTLVGGAAAGLAMSLLAVWLVARKQAGASVRELLAGPGVQDAEAEATPKTWALGAAVVTGLAAVAVLVLALRGSRQSAAELFFAAGALLLIAGLCGCRALLFQLQWRAALSRLSITAMALRGATRRSSRSLSVIALLACGSFLVAAIGASRQDARRDAALRTSGTGGFALYGETALPIFQDLNSREGRDAFGLDDSDLSGVTAIPLRVSEGDEASCLNLNRAQTPRLVGVDPDAFRRRGAFTFSQTVTPTRDPWGLLDRKESSDTVPAIGDVNTVTWSLGKSVGDTIPYTDDRGNPIRLRIVGILANCVLQGSLVISERQFQQRFPSKGGFSALLLDAPSLMGTPRLAELQRTLSRVMEDTGLSLIRPADRMAELGAVENTYLAIFATLGGLGLILGSVGLGVVALRNVLERRGELASLRAIGFTRPALIRMVMSEHVLLLGLGLGVGVVSALVAAWPALSSPGTQVPYAQLGLLLAGMLASGILWTWAATSLALRGPLLPALREE